MNMEDKIIIAHKGYRDANSKILYRENSKEACAASGASKEIGIIELDLRKSADGVLYCYHGSFLEYCFYLKFSKDLPVIKQKYHVDSLQDILAVIPEEKIIFLDLKDNSIVADDILNAFSGKKFKEVILGNRSVSFLRRFNALPGWFVKIMNRNTFCNFYDLQKLNQDRFKYFQVLFPFQISEKTIKRVHANGMEFGCATLFFWSRKSYWNAINKFQIKHISSDFI